MPLVKVRFSIDGDRQYVRAFELYDYELRDLTEPLTHVGGILLESVGAQFATEGAESGHPWRPLSAAYKAWKAAHFPGAQILVRTGQLRFQVLDPAALTILPDKLVYEPDSALAAWHQRGAGHLPARKIVDLNLGRRRSFDRAFAEWVTSVRRGPIGAHL